MPSLWTGAAMRVRDLIGSVGQNGTNLDFGAWEGTVLTYGPRGDVANVEHAPRF